MAKTYYEAHVTMTLPVLSTSNLTAARKLIEGTGWKFSCIDGDIALGSGVKIYATTHWNSKIPVEDAITLLHRNADALAARGLNVIRRKVELVIYDDRSTKIQPGTCEGACVACHLDDYEERDLKASKG